MASEILSRIRRPFRYSFKNATLSIIAINAVVYFLFNFTNLIPVGEDYFSINVVGFVFHQCFWQPLTYMFMHGNIQHLFFNMLGLLFFGMQVERALGSKEFVMMYLVVGVLSGLFSVGVYYALGAYMVSQGMYPYTYLVSLVGASGAIYGILLAYAVIFPRSRIFVWFVIPVPAPILVIAYAVIEFVSQFTGSSNVAHQTHLAGFAFAFLYMLVRMGVNPIRVWRDVFRR